MRILSFMLAVMTITFSANAQSAADTIRAGQFQLKYLPEGTQRYLVYVERNKVKRGIWLWERTTTREVWNGKPSILVKQQWSSSDTGFNSRQLLSVVDEKTFVPIYHNSWNPKSGREAFNYHVTEIVTADSVPDAGKKGFRQAISEPGFNWELDLETFPLLPLKEGKIFLINFYHPGSSTGPGWYKYAVTGSEKIRTVNGQTVDCFKLYTEYANNAGNSTWWLSKQTHEVLKMEEHFGQVTRYKIKLAVPDL